jgi:hypothetical protein
MHGGVTRLVEEERLLAPLEHWWAFRGCLGLFSCMATVLRG